MFTNPLTGRKCNLNGPTHKKLLQSGIVDWSRRKVELMTTLNNRFFSMNIGTEDYLTKLPTELIEEICMYIDNLSILNLFKTCQRMHNIIPEPRIKLPTLRYLLQENVNLSISSSNKCECGYVLSPRHHSRLNYCIKCGTTDYSTWKCPMKSDYYIITCEPCNIPKCPKCNSVTQNRGWLCMHCEVVREKRDFSQKWRNSTLKEKLEMHGIVKLRLLAKKYQIKCSKMSKYELIDILSGIADHKDFPIVK